MHYEDACALGSMSEEQEGTMGTKVNRPSTLLAPRKHPSQHTLILIVHFPCKNVEREGSVQSNHRELMWKNSTHRAISATHFVIPVTGSRRFALVRGGSSTSNLVHSKDPSQPGALECMECVI